jgi:hypothetical protein
VGLGPEWRKDFDPSRALSNVHRLGLPKLYMLKFDVRLRHLA